VKQREPRRKVLISARMRAGSAWSGVSLLNLSSRGALAQAEVSPPTGSYIEIRRGGHVIVARVVWAEQQRFGFRTQDLIGVDAILADPDAPAGPTPGSQRPSDTDRRATPRAPASSERDERSRAMARHMEYCCLAGAAALMASVALSIAKAALTTPMSQLSAALTLQ